MSVGCCPGTIETEIGHSLFHRKGWLSADLDEFSPFHSQLLSPRSSRWPARSAVLAGADTGFRSLGADFAPLRSIRHSRGGPAMRRPVVHYRDKPKFVLRRLDRIAGEVNTILIVVALGLGMLDLIYALQKLVDVLPPAVQVVAHAP